MAMVVYGFGNSHIWNLLEVDHGRSDVEVVGDLAGRPFHTWKLGSSGATAWALVNESSRTGAGSEVRRILDERRSIPCTVILFFGEVDVTDHIGKHEDRSIELHVEQTIERYRTFIIGISERSNVEHVIIMGTVPHHSRFRPDEVERLEKASTLWDLRLRHECDAHGWSFIDVQAVVDGQLKLGRTEEELFRDAKDPQERHLSWGLATELRSVVSRAIPSVVCGP